MPYLLHEIQGAEEYLLYESGAGIGDFILSDGHLGNGFYFDGASKQIDVASYPAIDFEYNQAFSLVIWFVIKTFLPYNVVILDKRVRESIVKGYSIGYSGDQIYFSLGGILPSGADQLDQVNVHYPLSTNQLYQLVISKSATYNQAAAYHCYINGLPQPFSFFSLPFLQSNKTSVPLRLGATQATSPFSNLDGYLMDVKIYNTALTPNQVEESYFPEGETPASLINNLVLHLPFDEKEGISVKNTKGTNGQAIGFLPSETQLGVTNRWVDAYKQTPIIK